MRALALALVALLLAPAVRAQEAPAEIALTPAEGQNFAADTTGALRIVGDESRYDIVLPTDILFDFDEATLRPDARPLLDQLRAHFAGIAPDQLHVRGHTGSKGSDEYNLTLSIDRATAVCDWLREEAGVAFTNCAGFGEREPLVPNEDPDGADNAQNRQLNRRVTISVVIYPDVDAMMGAAEGQADAALGGAAAAQEGDATALAGGDARARTRELLDEAQGAADAALDALPDAGE